MFTSTEENMRYRVGQFALLKNSLSVRFYTLKAKSGHVSQSWSTAGLVTRLLVQGTHV